MILPHGQITKIPNNEPEAVPGLWNARYAEIDENFAALVNGISNVDNTLDANKPVSTAQAAADAATLNSAKTYADGLVVGLWDDRGNFNASTNAFPTTGGSGASGEILKGDIWTISVAASSGPMNGMAVGSTVRALVDTPGQTTGNWSVTDVGQGYVPENVAGKDASGGYVGLTLLKINFKNALNTFTSFLTNSNTAQRTYTFQDRDGTIADNTDLANKVTVNGALGTPTSGNLANCTFPTLNQNTTGSAGSVAWSGVTGKPDPALKGRLTATQLQNNTTLPPGIYTNSGDGLYKADGVTVAIAGWWHVINCWHTDSNGYNAQIAVELSNVDTAGKENANRIMMRVASVGAWTEWSPIAANQVILASASWDAQVNQHVFYYGAAGGVISLPSAPYPGDTVTVTSLYSGAIVSRNGKPIMRLAEDMTIDVANTTVTFRYIEPNQGWQIV